MTVNVIRTMCYLIFVTQDMALSNCIRPKFQFSAITMCYFWLKKWTAAGILKHLVIADDNLVEIHLGKITVAIFCSLSTLIMTIFISLVDFNYLLSFLKGNRFQLNDILNSWIISVTVGPWVCDCWLPKELQKYLHTFSATRQDPS